jgi:hypothetical protein
MDYVYVEYLPGRTEKLIKILRVAIVLAKIRTEHYQNTIMDFLCLCGWLMKNK